MPEPFKEQFNPALIAAMGDRLHACEPSFHRDRFVAAATAGLDRLELKERSAHIARALESELPADFGAACDLMLAALHAEANPPGIAAMDGGGIRGWAVMPMAEVVAARGIDHFDLSMDVLREMTKRFTAEFAVRPFILHDQTRALGHILTWAGDADPHVRRLASEGSRPRLPWGIRLQPFVADPAPLIPLLTRLRDDPSDYVRRSVANSLNDIAKDHPDLVAEIARDWLADAPPERRKLVRHACRTLIKQGHGATLAALGYAAPALTAELRITTPVVRFGEALEFELEVASSGDGAQALVLDYVIHHRKANGSLTPKVFKWRTLTLAPGARLRLTRRHPMRPITTRVYRDGTHRLEVVANGAPLGTAAFELTGAESGAARSSG